MTKNPPPVNRLLLKRFYRRSDDYLSHDLFSFSPEDLFGKHEILSSSLSFLNEGYSYYAGGSCDCLLYFDDLDGEIVIWNPTTKEKKHVPGSDVQRPPGITSTSFQGSGFGFDSKSQDFKVIRFMTHYYEKEYEGRMEFLDCKNQVELYSLNKDSWEEISDAPDVSIGRNYPAYVDGSYYWLAYGSSPCSDFTPLEFYGFILSYDFTNGTFSSFPFPIDNIHPHIGLDLVVFDGLLGFTIIRPPNKDGSLSIFELWVLNLNNLNVNQRWSWTSKLALELKYDNIGGDIVKPLGFCKLLDESLLFFEGINCQVVVYNFTTKEFKKVDGIQELESNMNKKSDREYYFPRKMEIFSFVERSIPLLQGSTYNMDTSEELSDAILEQSKVSEEHLFGYATDEDSVEFKRQKLDLSLST